MTQTLDATTDTDEVTWDVLYRNFNTVEGSQSTEAYSTDKVTAAELVLDAGTLVFRTIDGELVRAYGPGGWLEVTRA